MRIDVNIPEMHKTRKLLLETVIKEISTRETSAISSEEILGLTGISRGSLYHHFTDYSDLVETAQFLIVERFIAATSQLALAAVRDNEDPLIAATQLMEVIANAHSFNSIQTSFSLRIRTLQLELLVASLTRPKIRAQVQELQDLLTATWMETIEICKQRGWAESDLDTRSTSVLIQSAFFGRSLDDFASGKMVLASWTATIQRALRYLLFSNAKI